MTGSKFNDLEVFLKEEYIASISNKLQAWHSIMNLHTKIMQPSVSCDEVMKFLGGTSPSSDLLRETYIGHLNNHQAQVHLHLKSLTARFISMDHTFKVSVNIGYERDDKVWVTLYDSLFCVLNESGHILAYTFSKDRSFDTIRQPLIDVKNLLESQGKNIELIAIDNCCQWRNQLKKIYGADTPVKLDVFHAVQRITKTIGKAVCYRTEMMRQLRQVFRQDSDSGSRRQDSTPETEQMLSQFDKFVEVWTEKVNEDTNKALGNLRKHIATGCLSDIPSGFGTNRNERLHRLLNKSALCVGRIGPELAHSLLHGIVYIWNARKLHGYAKPLYVPCGIVPQTTGASLVEGTSVQSTMRLVGQQLATADSHANENSHLEETTGPSIVEGRSLQSTTTLVGQQLATADSHSTENSRLEVAAAGFAHSNHHKIHHIEQVWVKLSSVFAFMKTSYDVTKFVYAALHFESVAQVCDVIEPPEYAIGKLALKPNGAVHKIRFVTSDESDTSLRALMNFLKQYGCQNKMSVVLVSNNTAFPVIPIAITDSPHIVYFSSHVDKEELIITKLSLKEQHFENNTSSSSIEVSNNAMSVSGCRCGERKKSVQQSCITGAGNYKCCCPCLRAGDGCTSKCRCLNCSNPYGKSSNSDIGKKRRAPKFSTPKPSSKRLKSEKFLEMSDAIIPRGPWKDIETIALQLAMTKYDTSSALMLVYNKLVGLCSSESCGNVIRTKELTNVIHKQQHIVKTIKGLLKCSDVDSGSN